MSTRQGIFLVGHTSESICEPKLPSNGQFLSTLFYHSQKNKTIGELLCKRPCYFRQELGYTLNTRQEYNIVAKPVSLFEEWRTLLKSKGKKSKFQQAKEEAFTEKLKDLLDMAHQNAMKMIKIQEVRDLLNAQRQKGHQ